MIEGLLIGGGTLLFCGLVAAVLLKLARKADTAAEPERPVHETERQVHQTVSANQHEPAPSHSLKAATVSGAPRLAPPPPSGTPGSKPKAEPLIQPAARADMEGIFRRRSSETDGATGATLPIPTLSNEDPRSRMATPDKPVGEAAQSTTIDKRLGRLFISYRREDTADAAGRLCDRLTDVFGTTGVFMDIDSVPLGIDFIEHVTDEISKCRAVIVMIGRHWLTVEDKRGRRRLELESDLVRAEVAAALQQKVPVIPVLVQDAEMPSAEELPENIRTLARRNGIDLSGAAWRAGVERLIKELDRVMKG